jgi:hypothetical protein
MRQGGNLDRLPEELQSLITAEIRYVFADPQNYFRSMAKRAPVASMKEWLVELFRGECTLDIFQWRHGEPRAYFAWESDDVPSANITLPCVTQEQFPIDILNQFFALTDGIDWLSGRIFSCDSLGKPYTPDWMWDKDIRDANPRIFGMNDSGDQLIFTPDDRAGWLSHEAGGFYSLGSVAEAFEWIFAELVENRYPELNRRSFWS